MPVCNLDRCPFACEGYVKTFPYDKEEAKTMPSADALESFVDNFWSGEQ